MAQASKESAKDNADAARKQKATARRDLHPVGTASETTEDREATDERVFAVGQAVTVDYNGEDYSASISRHNVVEGTYRVLYTVDNTYEDVDPSRISASA